MSLSKVAGFAGFTRRRARIWTALSAVMVGAILVTLAGATSVFAAGHGPAATALAQPASVPHAEPMALSQVINDRPDPYSVLDRAALAPSARAGAAPPTGVWQPLGPAPIGPPYLALGGAFGGANSGRVTGVAVIASGALGGRVVTASAGGGIWTSDDNGSTWTARTDSAPTLAIGSVTVDPSNPSHLIAGTGEGNQSGDSAYGLGILTSTDGGTTWTLSDPGNVFQGAHISQVAIDPSSSSRMFAATDRGLYVTADGAASWAKPTDPSYAGVDGTMTAVVIDPSTPATIYIGGAGADVAKSTDGGATWAAANAGLAAQGTNTALALAPSSPGTLYASVGSSVNPVSLYQTTNGATSWTQLRVPDYTGQTYAYGVGSGEQGSYDNVVAVDPTNANHVLAGGIALVETTDGGATWNNPNGHNFFHPHNLLGTDQHALVFRPDGRVWIGDDEGVFLYDPSSHAVTNANGNLDITQFYFGFSEVGGTVLAGSQDNSSARTSSSSLGAWTGISVGDGGPCAITPNDTSVQFIVSTISPPGDLFVTTDAFASGLFVKKITPPGAGGAFTPPMVVVPNTTTPSSPTVFFGGADLFRSTNPTDVTPTWTRVTSVGTVVSAIAVAPSNPNVVYVGFEDGTIEVSSDGGSSFSVLANQPFGETFVTGLSVDPSNSQAITASVSYHYTREFIGHPHVAQYSYSTSPGTGSWTVITGDLPPIGAVSRVVYDNGSLVAATDAGVYATSTPAGSSTTWSPVGSGMPAVQVQDLYVDPGNGALFAVTHGRGAWRLGPAPTPTTTTTTTTTMTTMTTTTPSTTTTTSHTATTTTAPTTTAVPTNVATAPTGSGPPTTSAVTAASKGLAFTGPGPGVRWVGVVGGVLILLGCLLALVDVPRRAFLRLGKLGPRHTQHIILRTDDSPFASRVPLRRRMLLEAQRGARWLLGR